MDAGFLNNVPAHVARAMGADEVVIAVRETQNALRWRDELLMSKIAVVTDSCADLPEELIEQWDIHVVPFVVAFRGQAFHDGVDVTSGELYRWQRASRDLPTTSVPSMGDLLRVYATLGAQVDGIVSIHTSSQLTAIYNMAVAASQLIDGGSFGFDVRAGAWYTEPSLLGGA